MAKGLDGLLSNLLRYTIIIKRPSFSWDTGRFQSAKLVLFEDEKVVEDGLIDPRLVKAKQVTLIAISRDRGIARINLTTRQVQYLAYSPGLSGLMLKFANDLLSGARSRWFTPGAALAAFIIPFFGLIAVPFVDILVNPHLRHLVTMPNEPKQLPYDHWTTAAGLAILVIWLFMALVAGYLGLVRVWAGPLLLWPKNLTLRSILGIVYRIRISTTLRENTTTVLVSVITALVVFVITKLL
jgi:hypothetical protein